LPGKWPVASQKADLRQQFLFLIFAIVSFILEKIPLGLTATIVAIGLNVTGVLD
jgi:di/tricarboxylate transporter